jgi:hypothetical protein
VQCNDGRHIVKRDGLWRIRLLKRLKLTIITVVVQRNVIPVATVPVSRGHTAENEA